MCPGESIKPYEKSRDSSDGTQKKTTELYTQALESYFADQKRRDQAHKEKIAMECDFVDQERRSDQLTEKNILGSFGG